MDVSGGHVFGEVEFVGVVMETELTSDFLCRVMIILDVIQKIWFSGKQFIAMTTREIFWSLLFLLGGLLNKVFHLAGWKI
jgi:hypothetical protein